MKISALLNSPGGRTRLRSSASEIERRRSEEYVRPSQIVSKMKSKPANETPNVASSGSVEEINFNPYLASTARIAKKHRDFNISPSILDIPKFSKTIPYASDKRKFGVKTGRTSQVFQYTFEYGKDGPWTVMWDYQVGLVRITPFFKALGYLKTVPKKAITANDGLLDICHSITGGAIAAQGYWMPFAAAKALAATFCWEIRYALTPVFGNDFPESCLQPEDPAFGRYTIDHAIVKGCTEVAKASKNSVDQKGHKKNATTSHPKQTSFAMQENEESSTSSRPSTAMTSNTGVSDPPHSMFTFEAHGKGTAPRWGLYKIKRGRFPALGSSATTSPTPLSPSPDLSSVRSSKRGFNEVGDNQDDGSEDEAANRDAHQGKRRKVRLSYEETRAAYALVLMSRSSEVVHY